MQALSCGYFLFFLSVLLVLWVLWFAVGRWTVQAIRHRRRPFRVAALVLLPFLLGYQAILRDTYGFTAVAPARFACSARMSRASCLPATSRSCGAGCTSSIARSRRSSRGSRSSLLAALAIVQARPFGMSEDEHGAWRVTSAWRSWRSVLCCWSRAAIPIVHGPWPLTIGPVRLLSIGRADKPLTLALIAALALIAMLPRVRAAIGRRSPLGFYLLAAFLMWVFALGPDPTFLHRR